jgi:serine/threonine protein kinase
MAASSVIVDFLACVQQSNLLSPADFTKATTQGQLLQNAAELASWLIAQGLLTTYQAKLLLSGKHRGFFLGQYKILEPIGKGGMGAIYLAHHMTLNRKVALKILPKENAKNPLELERFHREARTAALLNHPNVVRVSDVAQSNGLHFLVMEYVEGVTLQQILDRSGPLPSDQAVKFIIQAAIGLQAAHDAGLVHRDIKPANLIIDKAGTLKILDFGLARSTDNASDHLTEKFDEGSFAGTADFVSPEQAMSQPTDHRSDIYSLGATLFVLLTGRPPFEGTITQKLLAHQVREVPNVCAVIRTIPPHIEGVIRKMMGKSPDDRFASMTEVIRVLQATSQAVRLSTPPSTVETTPSPFATLEDNDTPTAKAQPINKTLWLACFVLLTLLVSIGGVLALLTSGIGSQPVSSTPSQKVNDKADVAKAEPPKENKPPVNWALLPDLIANWSDTPSRFCLTHDARQLVVLGGKKAEVWQLPEVTSLGTFGIQDEMKTLCIAPDGNQVVYGGRKDGVLRLRELSSNSEQWVMMLPGAETWLAEFMPDGKRILAVSTKPGLARILSAKNGSEVSRFSVGSSHHSFLSRNGQLLVVPDAFAGQVEIYDTTTGNRLRTIRIDGGPRTAILTKDGQTLIVGGGGWRPEKTGWLSAFDVTSGELKYCFEAPGALCCLSILSFSPNEDYVAAGSRGAEVYLWETKTGKLVSIYLHSKGWTSLARFTPEGSRLISIAQDKSIRSWRVPTSLPETTKRVIPRVNRKVVARYPMDTLKPFAQQLDATTPSRELAQWPLWAVGVWHKGLKAQAETEISQGTLTLGLRNLDGPPHVQLATIKPLLTQEANVRYVVQVRYSSEKNAKGYLELRRGPAGTEQIKRVPLPKSENTVALVEITHDGVAGQPLYAVIANSEKQDTLRIESIDVLSEPLK